MTAVLKCLPKKGDLTKITNWCPVSLLNTDYKILTRALAERLGKVLPLIVSEDQTCNVRGRTIHHNTALIRDIIDYANDNDIPASLISVDQMKAFDRVDWKFMFKTLQQFNLGPIFINWIRLIYKDINSKVKRKWQTLRQFRSATRRSAGMPTLSDVIRPAGGGNPCGMHQLNWQSRVQSFIKILQIWKQRALSMKGKKIVNKPTSRL